MTKEVDFYFDFASPNAYLSHKVLKSISEKTGAKVNYIPVLWEVYLRLLITTLQWFNLLR